MVVEELVVGKKVISDGALETIVVNYWSLQKKD